jgi:hypothetical protein
MIIEESDLPAAPEKLQPVPTETDASVFDAFPTVQQPDDLPPLSAANIPSAEFQFGVAGRSENVRAMVADGRLRRLPSVESTEALPAMVDDERIQVADRPQESPIYR